MKDHCIDQDLGEGYTTARDNDVLIILLNGRPPKFGSVPEHILRAFHFWAITDKNTKEFRKRIKKPARRR